MKRTSLAQVQRPRSGTPAAILTAAFVSLFAMLTLSACGTTPHEWDDGGDTEEEIEEDYGLDGAVIWGRFIDSEAPALMTECRAACERLRQCGVETDDDLCEATCYWSAPQRIAECVRDTRCSDAVESCGVTISGIAPSNEAPPLPYDELILACLGSHNVSYGRCDDPASIVHSKADIESREAWYVHLRDAGYEDRRTQLRSCLQDAAPITHDEWESMASSPESQCARLVASSGAISACFDEPSPRQDVIETSFAACSRYCARSRACGLEPIFLGASQSTEECLERCGAEFVRANSSPVDTFCEDPDAPDVIDCVDRLERWISCVDAPFDPTTARSYDCQAFAAQCDDGLRSDLQDNYEVCTSDVECVIDSDCPDGRQCVNGTCLAIGPIRFTLQWDTGTDLDLHVLTPTEEHIYFGNSTTPEGFLDRDEIPGGPGSIENIVIEQPISGGRYEFYVRNFNGRQAADFTVDVFINGEREVRHTDRLPGRTTNSSIWDVRYP